MAGGACDDEDRATRPNDEAALSARLKRLDEQLSSKFAASRSQDGSPGPSPTADPSAFARGIRLSTELVAGVLVGAGLGWLIDRGLGISPWGFIVFVLLGFTAGVVNVIRTAGVVSSGEQKD